MLYLTVFSSDVFADMTPNSQPILYCPHHIECTMDGKLESCLLSDNDYGVWGKPFNTGRVVKGIYTLKNATASYQTRDAGTNGNPNGQLASCNYSMISSQRVEKLMTVYISHQQVVSENYYSPVFFEAFLSSDSQWSVSGEKADCISDNPKSCPLTEIPEISLNYRIIGSNINRSFYWEDNSHLNTVIIRSNRISYDGLLSLCGATTSCKVNIGENNREHTPNGVITLDISQPDVVKVVYIQTDKSSSCILKKATRFNTIICES